jgi:hypothetical protein
MHCHVKFQNLICDYKLVDRRSYMAHLKSHLDFGQIEFPIKCVYCKVIFHSLYYYNKHLLDLHANKFSATKCRKKRSKIGVAEKNIGDVDMIDDHNEDEFELAEDLGMNVDEVQDELEPFELVFSKIQEIFKLHILEFRADGKVSESLTLRIVAAVKNIVAQTIHGVFKIVKLAAEDKAKIVKLKSSFDDFDTIYKQDKYITKSNDYIKPVEKQIAIRRELRNVNKIPAMIQIIVKFQYFSIKGILKNFLSIKEVSDYLAKNDAVTEKKNDFFPLKYQNHYWRNKNLIKLLFYYDEIEVKNVLGYAAGNYKFGSFKFIVLNLGRKNNSKLSNIFNAILCYAQDVQKYGMQYFTNIIYREMNELETSGFSINGNLYHVTLAQTAADNLGARQLNGLKANFNGNFICHLCNASTKMIQKHHVESAFTRTTEAAFNERIEKYRQGKEIQHHGIKTESPLNRLKNYHVVSNFSFDIMHDIWEGIVPLEIKLILKHFVFTKHYFKLRDLSDRIVFFNYGAVEFYNRPAPIYNLDRIKQTASKMACLFYFLPLIIGDKIPDGDPHWDLYLQLHDIINIVHTVEISQSLLVELEWKIEQHHYLFKSLFPSENLRLKHHNLVHYPTAIRELGSLVDYSCIRFEADHVFVKTAAVTAHNTINLLYTVAKKLQINQLLLFKKQNFLNERFEIVKSELVDLEFVRYKFVIEEKFKVKQFLEIQRLLFCGEVFEPGFFFLIKKNIKREIGKIINILFINNSYYFHYALYDKVFDSHIYCFEVLKNNAQTEDILEISETNIDYKPLNSYNTLRQGDNRELIKQMSYYM